MLFICIYLQECSVVLNFLVVIFNIYIMSSHSYTCHVTHTEYYNTFNFQPMLNSSKELAWVTLIYAIFVLFLSYN
jgi:hypothetical protein